MARAAASATGPRKNNPGVRSSPTASRTAAIAQPTHADMSPVYGVGAGRPSAAGRAKRSSIRGSTPV